MPRSAVWHPNAARRRAKAPPASACPCHTTATAPHTSTWPTPRTASSRRPDRRPESYARVMPERIGFLGLGIMGSRMAARVAQAGFPLTVWTHTPGKAAAWASEHDAVVAADTPAAVARASE